MIEILLAAALGTGLMLLSKAAGLEAKADEWGAKLAGLGDAGHIKSLQKAVKQAAKKSRVEGPLKELLKQKSFQQEVVRALLDPFKGFDLETATHEWSGKLPEYAPGLRKYFNTLQYMLGMDDYWRETIEFYQKMRTTPEGQSAVLQGLLPATELELVQNVSGTLVQGDGNTVVGAGGVLIQQTIEKVVNKYITREKHTHYHYDSSEEKIQNNLLRRYLEKQRRHCNALPLAAMGGEESSEADITLDQVYIDLDTTTKITLSKPEQKKQKQKFPYDRDEKERPLSALEAFTQSPHLALLGEPGGGKSTFTRHLLAWQAAFQLNEAKQSPPGLDSNLLPVMVVLRELTPWLLTFDPAKVSQEKQGAALLEIFWKAMQQSLEVAQIAEFKQPMIERFENKSVFLVLDGLDEVPQDDRKLVRKLVGNLVKEYQLPRILVTCRIRSYQDEAVLPDFVPYTLAPFDKTKIQHFINGWYNAQLEADRIKKNVAEDRIKDLTRAALSQDLLELSDNPMMLTTMAIIHQEEVGLPKERVRLYNLAVDILMRRWQKHKFSEQDLAGFLKDELRLRRSMERIAYEAHKTGLDKKGSADISRQHALEVLKSSDCLGNEDLAVAFLDHIDQRAGLLVGQGGSYNNPVSYSFPHRTFQEYLAGCYMVGQRDICREFFARAGEGDYWSLAACLGMEELYYNRRNINGLLDLAYQLCPAEVPVIEQSRRAVLWSGIMAMRVKKETIELDDQAPGGGRQYLSHLIEHLLKIIREGLPALERADAGNALARLGDPRPEVMTVEGMRFCHVPAGRFWMGSDNGDDDEKPKHELDLPEFWISQYPVSQAQFDCFVLAGGYEKEDYWPEAVQLKYWNRDGFKGKYDDRPRKTNFNPSEPFNLPNHPVVGISWYESLAFCRWLEEQLRQKGHFLEIKNSMPVPFGGNWSVGLPGEAQWEKAARGIDGRDYPWGDEFNPDKANTVATGIRATSVLGCFPDGASPYGVLEMSGNAWEWTRDNYENSDMRIFRGGAFYYDARSARCAFRLGFYPDYGDDFIGFRIILSPPSS